MTLGGCTSPKQSMPPSKAVEMVTERMRQFVDFEKDTEIGRALNTIHLAINENENLHTDIDEMARIIKDLNDKLQARTQAVFR